MDWLFEHDTALKVLAVLVAIAVWAQVNLSTPPQVDQSVHVSVSFIPPVSSALHVTTPSPAHVTVVIKGPPTVVTKDTGVSAWVNLSKVAQPGTTDYGVEAGGLPPGTSLVNVVPASVSVTVVRYLAKSFSVKLRTSGALAPGYGVETMSIQNPHAVVTGPSALVDRVAGLVAAVPLSDRASSFSSQVALIAVDANGRAVKGVTVSPASRTANVTVLPEKTLAVTVKYSGKPASGYAIGPIQVSPLRVTVFGPASVLSGLTTIYTDPVNISGATGPVSADAALALPTGVAAAVPASVSVIINIQ